MDNIIRNLTVAVMKILVGMIKAQYGADGFHSITDGSSNIAGLVVYVQLQPIDQDHPYGG